MTSLSSLLARIESATGHDRLLDLLIHEACGRRPAISGDDNRKREMVAIHDEYFGVEGIGDDGAIGDPITPVTASLDAAIALCERALPGLTPLIGAERNLGFDNDIPGAEDEPRWNAWCYGHSGRHPTSPALALCAAIVKARMET